MKFVGPSTNPSLAFTNGSRGLDRYGKPFRIQVEQAGELLVTSGSIIASDPCWLYDALAFTTRVPPGRYPVLLSIMLEEGVAFAQVRLSEQEAVRWEMALCPGQDVSTLKPGQFFGCPVDTATGCYLDQDTFDWFFEQPGLREYFSLDQLPLRTQEDEDERKKIIDTFHDLFIELLYEPLFWDIESNPWLYKSLTINPTTGGNLVAFSTGIGDGTYPSYFSYAADGSLTSLTTDFFLLKNAEWDASLS